MTIFANDDNVTCALVPMRDSNEEDAFFEAYLEVEQARRKWQPKVFWANANQTHKILVLCRTRTIKDRVKALTQIKPALVSDREQQASNAGFVSHTIEVDGFFAIIYY